MMPVGLYANMSGGVHRCSAERARGTSGGDHRSDLGGERETLVEIEAPGDFDALLRCGFETVARSDLDDPVSGIDPDRQSPDAKIEVRVQWKHVRWTDVVHWSRTVLVLLLAEPCFDRLAEGRKLFLLHPAGCEFVVSAQHAKAKLATAGLAHCLSRDSNDAPKIPCSCHSLQILRAQRLSIFLRNATECVAIHCYGHLPRTIFRRKA